MRYKLGQVASGGERVLVWYALSGVHELQDELHSSVSSVVYRSVTVGGQQRENCNSQSGTVQGRQQESLGHQL